MLLSVTPQEGEEMRYPPSQGILAAIYRCQKKKRQGHAVAAACCGRCNEFFYYQPPKEPHRLYCETCQPVVDADRRKKQYRRNHPQVKLTCEYCGGTFVPKRNDSRYCSGKCRQAAYRVRKNFSVTNGVQSR